MAPSISEFEDLTQYADESFDTDEVDLFEFTGRDDSPLIRLKSIILSLDWEITDEILGELTDELINLQSMWADDKVAQIYLQAMDNVGKYLQEEGAYAHTNAMKLLLTLFYNYEKIISASDISGEEITSMLKSDIRKFKVLQYQIGKVVDTQEDSAKKTEPVEEVAPDTPVKLDPMAALQATILGLEWEVTDKGLDTFNDQAQELREHLDDDSSQILVQGLQALGAYLKEEKANAHPDAFTILHSFYEGLKTLVEDKDLDTEQRQKILVDRVGRLNSLKEIIAGALSEKTDEKPIADDVDSVLNFDGEDEQDELITETSADDELSFGDDDLSLGDDNLSLGDDDLSFGDDDEMSLDDGLSLDDDELSIDFDFDSTDGDDQGFEEPDFNDDTDSIASVSSEDEFSFNDDTDSIASISDDDEISFDDDTDSIASISDDGELSFDDDTDSIASISDDSELSFDDDTDSIASLSDDNDFGFDDDNDSIASLSDDDEMDFDFLGDSDLDADAIQPVTNEIADHLIEEELAGSAKLAKSHDPVSEKSDVIEDNNLEDEFGLLFDDDNEDIAIDEELVAPALSESDEESGFTDDFESA
ncbi:MAG: hypothetical protein KAI39_01975, partial [Desulfobulbaceae bacterium]|nr:hypothetical protein [Desulfobulbaceae bacterium]